MRQPFRMTNDPQTGNLWLGDVGSQGQEEIDLIDGPGYNFEWSYKEGTQNGFQPKPNPFIGTERPPFCLLYTSPSPRDRQKSRMPSSA